MRGLAGLWFVLMTGLVVGLSIVAFLMLPITWAAPHWRPLAIIGLIATVSIAMLWWRRERDTRRFGSQKTLAKLIIGSAPALRVARGTILVIGMTLVAISLAQPQYGSRTRTLRKRGVDIVIALDFSKSMLARDVRPSRIDRAKAELTRLLAELDGDRVGVVAFAGETMEFPMTVDYSAVGLFLRDLGPYDMPVGGTAIGRALIASQRLLERSNRRPPSVSEEEAEQQQRSQVVILITDGEDHEGDPVSAANELANAGIQVITVGVGSRSGEPIPTYSPDGTWTGYVRDEDGNIVQTALTEEGEQTLEQIAERTNGEFLRAREGSVGISEIRERLRAMHQSESESRRITVHEPRYALVLLPAFLLLLLEFLLPHSWIGRRQRRRPRPKKSRRRAT